jgi:hypothetical protein
MAVDDGRIVIGFLGYTQWHFVHCNPSYVLHDRRWMFAFRNVGKQFVRVGVAGGSGLLVLPRCGVLGGAHHSGFASLQSGIDIRGSGVSTLYLYRIYPA